MAKVKKQLLLCVIIGVAWLSLSIMTAINNSSARYLGNGFFFSANDEFHKHIWYWRLFEKEHNEIGVPPDIINFKKYNRYILVKQKPKEHDDVIDIHCQYPLGRDTVYYWIIQTKTKSILGPMDKEKMVACQDSLHVPDLLRLR